MVWCGLDNAVHGGAVRLWGGGPSAVRACRSGGCDLLGVAGPAVVVKAKLSVVSGEGYNVRLKSGKGRETHEVRRGQKIVVKLG
jgi:hypothetical protein